MILRSKEIRRPSILYPKPRKKKTLRKTREAFSNIFMANQVYLFRQILISVSLY